MTRTRIFVLSAVVSLGGIALAQRPKENVSGARHPNLAAETRRK